MKKLVLIVLTLICLLTAVGMVIPISAAGSYIRGDADGDGYITSVDATWIQYKLASFNIPFDFDDLVADVDGDGSVTSVDATWIQRYLAKMHVPYDIGQTKYEIIG